jgi:alpha-1,6-mannosyltransferase
MTLKTLHLTNSWHETSGGIATFYRALIEEANRQGRDIRLVVPAEHDRLETAGKFGKIYHVAASPALFNSSYRMIYPTQFLRAEGKLQQILLQERPDLVEICDKYTLNYLGAVLGKRLLCNLDFRPVIVGLSCERMDDNFRTYLGSFPLSQKFCSLYMKWLYFPFFDHHIANSEYTAAELRAVAQNQSAPRAGWIRHMGVDLSQLSPSRKSSSLRQRLLQNFGASEESVLLLYVGRLAPEKNLPLLFHLMRHLVRNSKRDFRLLVVGDGIERRRWQNETAGDIPRRVLFLGHIKDRNALAVIYANADLFVHPNPHEPFGIAPLEAMASGLPLIAPDAGGVTSYANPENAWTVPASVESFAAAIEEALSTPALTSQKAGKALTTAQAYRWETVAAAFLELYCNLHRASTGDAAALPPADFNSTLATGWRAALIRSAARTSERVFSAASRLILAAPFKPHLAGASRTRPANS